MTNFNPGDRVRRTGGNTWNISTGDTGVVERVSESGMTLQLRGKDGATFYSNTFELVEPAASTPAAEFGSVRVGDTVEILVSHYSIFDRGETWEIERIVGRGADARANGIFLTNSAGAAVGGRNRYTGMRITPEYVRVISRPGVTAQASASAPTPAYVPGENPALDAYRKLVRDKVISESERQGWCSRVDSWLGELGLEPREPEVAQELRRHGVIVRTPAGHVLKLEGIDSTPWREYRNGVASVWRDWNFVITRNPDVLVAGDGQVVTVRR